MLFFVEFCNAYSFGILSSSRCLQDILVQYAQNHVNQIKHVYSEIFVTYGFIFLVVTYQKENLISSVIPFL